MKTGIQLITEERHEQIELHHFDVEHDVLENTNAELKYAALRALGEKYTNTNMNCDWEEFEAAEIDRLQSIGEKR